MKKGIVYTTRGPKNETVIMPMQGYLLGNYGVYKDSTYCNLWCVVDIRSGLGVKYYPRLRDVQEVVNGLSGTSEWDNIISMFQNNEGYIQCCHAMQDYKSERHLR